MVFPVFIYACESWTIKKAEHWRTDAFDLWVLEKTLESPLECKEIKTVNSKENQTWIFIGRMNAEVEAPILRPPAAKNWLIGKDPDTRKDWRQEEKGTTEAQMVWWYHWLSGHEFEQALGDGEGQGNLASYRPWGGWVGHNRATKQGYVVRRAIMSCYVYIIQSRKEFNCFGQKLGIW